ncbi:hypothetical protein ACQ86D_40330 [Streptomyces galilaeus]
MRTAWDRNRFYDKSADALIVLESASVDAATGEPLAETRTTLFVRGEGGFGGDRGSSEPWTPPSRPAPTRHSSTASPASTTPCTPTHGSPRERASTARSCTACAPTASPAAPSCFMFQTRVGGTVVLDRGVLTRKN